MALELKPIITGCFQVTTCVTRNTAKKFNVHAQCTLNYYTDELLYWYCKNKLDLDLVEVTSAAGNVIAFKTA